MRKLPRSWLGACASDEPLHSGKGRNDREPARLSPTLANNICMACHQTGDVRVLKPGKSYADIRPGKPLDEVLSILLVPPAPDSPPDADHVEHYYSMTLSKCYRSSAGRMSCISCHDPHVQPSPAEAPAYFARKCLACHTDQSCKIPLQVRMSRRPANDCAGCHMPKRDIQVISHSTATNHRIVARPEEPFPDITFHQTTTAMPDLINLDPAPGKEAAVPSGIDAAAGLRRAGCRQAAVCWPLSRGPVAAWKNPNLTMHWFRLQWDDANLKAGTLRQPPNICNARSRLGSPQATTCADLADALTHLDRKERSGYMA